MKTCNWFVKLKTQILFAQIQQKNHYKYRCKIAKIQLSAEEGTVRDWFVFGARWLETVRTGDATLAATDARLLLDHPRYVKLVQ